jgi:DNA polymerase-3 subunit chi
MPVTIHFYHLTTTPLERALPKLLERAYQGGFKTLVVTQSEEQLQRLNDLLWSYDPGSFLPHGSTADGNIEQQPILLSTATTPVNGAGILAITHGQIPENPEQFDRILDLFDGRDAQAVEHARQRWVGYKSAGHPLTYHRQTERGGWEQAASA